MALTNNKFLVCTTSPVGNRQTVTTSTLGEAEIAALDEWEVSGGKLQPKSGFAPNGVSIATAVTEYSKTFADFTSVGANLEVNSGTYQNATLEASVFSGGYQVSDASPFVTSASSVYSSPAQDAWKAFDNDTASMWLSNGGTGWLKIDFATTKTVVSYQITANTTGGATAARSPGSFTFEGSNDDAAWTTLDTRSGQTFGTSASSVYTISSPGAYRYYRLNVSANQSGDAYINVAGLEMTHQYKATTSNTADLAMHNGASTSFAPASLEVTDESDAAITTGNVNVDYALNGGAFTGSPIDIDAFKALSASTFASKTQLDIRLQPVGSQRIKGATIDSTSTESIVLQSGVFKVLVNAVEVGVVDSNGYTFPDATTQSTAVNKVSAPASAASTGTTGQIAWDDTYIYICTATNTWKRVATATW